MIDRTEKNVLYVAIILMLVFTGMVVYAGMGLGIVLPTCNDRVTPFTVGTVIPKGNNQFEVHYVARMWAFEPADLVLPEKAEVDLYLSALDVDHGFEVPGTNLNLMAVPGAVNFAHQRFEKRGEYLVICHEYCGLNHQNMTGKIRVVSREEYTRLMLELANRTLAAGERIAVEKQCTTCHTSDGTEGLAPTFKGLYGKRERLADGSEIVVDDAYLIDSIRNPDKQIVQNFDAGSMPPPDVPLSDEEVRQLIDYIKALK